MIMTEREMDEQLELMQNITQSEAIDTNADDDNEAAERSTGCLMQYREFMDLTDEEIIFIIKDIFPDTTKVDNIIRDTKWNRISCNIYIIPEYPDIPDELDLELPSWESCGITTHDFTLTDEEGMKWKQYLLAKGCDERLKDNPYLTAAGIKITKGGIKRNAVL